MIEMYEAIENSPQTTIAFNIDDIQTSIELADVSNLLLPPNLLTIGYDTPNPETVKYTEINGNTITVERGFEGTAQSWNSESLVARVYTAYDHNSTITNINDSSTFTNIQKFNNDNYIYFVGDVSNGWKVNRWDINNNIMNATGDTNKPMTLGDCESLSYI